jgi:membrane associated rhomboid family serine protease
MQTQITTLILVVANIIFSYNGFKNPRYIEDNVFDVGKILVWKEYKRLISSGFIHANLWHLGFNMMALYSFGSYIESVFGSLNFLLIYFVSLMGGSLLSLFLHRNNGDYSALGASGAVFGIVYSSIILDPFGEISLFMLLPLTSWAYGVLFIAISIFGIKSQAENIGHDAHLGGAIIGMLATIALQPTLLQTSLPIIMLLLIPSVFFIILLIRKPKTVLMGNFFFQKQGFQTMEDRYNARRAEHRKEVDRILEKISKKGIDSLTAKEKEVLEKRM